MSNPTETPNHALQRTATAVTARASAAAFPPTMHGPRQPPPSLSLGSFGVLTCMFSQRSGFVFATFIMFACGAFAEESLERQLSEAAGRGDLSETKRLVAAGANVNGDRPGYAPPLHSAIIERHEEVAVFLIDHGAALNQKSGPKEDTPLMSAASRNELAVIRCLLRHHADTTLTCVYGWTALQHAIKDKNPEAAKLLREHKTK